MSDYTYENLTNRLDIKTSVDPKDVFLWVHEGREQAAIHIPNADVPTVAAELLQAAGHGNLADLVGWESAEKKLQGRRDALAKDLSGDDVLRYEHIRSSLRKAIDRIIELEQGK